MATSSYKERQDDELQVLQAIFMDDFHDLRTLDAWKVDRPPEVCLTLKPQESFGNQGGEAYVQLDLKFSCSSTYPDKMPDIKIEKVKGLSNQQVDTLRANLTKQAKSLIGNEMMLELSQTAQSFLYANNKPPSKSFYEEMMSNQRKKEEIHAKELEKHQEILRKREEKEIQNIEDHIQRRTEELREESRKRREEQRQISEERNSPVQPELSSCSPIKIGTPSLTLMTTKKDVSPSPIIHHKPGMDQAAMKNRRRRTSTPRTSESDEAQCKHHTGAVVEIEFDNKVQRTIHRGTCLGHGLHGSTVYVGIDKKTGDLVAISEWLLKWRNVSRRLVRLDRDDVDKERTTYMKQVESIEQEMFSLLKLNHRNLLHYLAFKYIEEQGRVTVYVLMEYSGGQNLDIYLTRKLLPMEVLREYTLELLEALHYLHNKAVVHKNLRASSIFVDMTGRVRLADYSINKRLGDLFRMIEESKPGVKFVDQSSHVSRGGKKEDILQMGVLLLALSLGEQVDDMFPNIPPSLPAIFQDFLSKCLLRDDRLRWSSTQLLDHPFLKDPIPPAIQDAGEPDREKRDTDIDTGRKAIEEEEEEELNPLITAWEASGQSRLTNEFQVLKSLGKGGFGDVIKVKNKLDGRMYAIKRIPLNPKSQHFNRKITREVKLLSRLNHESVVRYYNSWIETSDENALSDSSSSWSGTPKMSSSEQKVSLPTNFLKNSLDLTDNIEKYAAEVAPADDNDDFSVDFSISYEASKSRALGFHGDDSDSSESEDEMMMGDVFSITFMEDKQDLSDSVVFEHNYEETENCDVQVDDKNKQNDAANKTETFMPMQYLYIQMEYCEKSTLRNCIDVGLYEDKDRVWRLFREVVDGLVHIHVQGIIHRDLKPVNIFLDSNDHVKIGDFGLATSDILSKGGLKDSTMFITSAADIHDNSSKSGSLGDGTLTGMVGTALYVSPEMMLKQNNKITYSQKVDIYSLGIIFFEMCYKPLSTGMERVQILGQLRQDNIVFPEDFDPVEMENQHKIIRWLLNHDPTQRPTSLELLQSEYIPAPKMEENELNEVLRSTISDTQSKSYHRLMNTLFSQTVSLADDHVYDLDFKGTFSVKSSLTHALVYNGLQRVFQRHGAIKLNTPLLMPRPKVYTHLDQYGCLMDNSGRLVGLPFDLRVPFARYITRANINHIKRYCIDKVYRRRKVGGFHPRELMECAFDIITTGTFGLIPDAEVIVVTEDIINEFPALQQRNYYIRVNHTSVLKAVLLHVGIPEDKHLQVLSSLSEVKRDTKYKQKALSDLSLSDQSVMVLLDLLQTEGPHGKVASILRIITKTKGQAATLARQGLHELEAVINNAHHLGLKLPVIVSVGWIFNTQLFSGMMFQVAVDVTRKKRTIVEVIAAGGRYDELIREFDYAQTNKQSGVGVSIAFEKIVSALQDQEDFQPPSAYDILVCTIGHKPMIKERMTLVRELWNAGLKAELLHETLEGQEEVQDFCRAQGISQLVILKDSEGSTVKVRSIEKEKITEKIIGIKTLVEFLQQKLTASETEVKPSVLTSQKSNTSNSNNIDNQHYPSSQGSNLSINFILQDGKLASNTRRKYEAQIVSKLSTAFSWLSMKNLEVVALDLTLHAIKVIAAFVDIDSTESAFESSIGTVIEKLPRYKKYMSKITDHIHRLVFEDKCSCIALYGIKDDSVKLLTSS